MRKVRASLAVFALLCLPACSSGGPDYEQIDADVKTHVMPDFPNATHFEVLSSISEENPLLKKYGTRIFRSGDTVDVVLTYRQIDEGSWELEHWKVALLASTERKARAIPWVVVVILAITMVYLLIRWRAKPHHHIGIQREELRSFIDGFMLRGGEGSQLFIQAEGTEYFVQFTKQAASDSRFALQFICPNTSWSQVYYVQLKSLFASEEWPHIERESAVAGVAHFLCVENIRSSEDAVHLVSHAFDVLGVGRYQTFRLSFEPPLSRDQWKQRVEQFRQTAGST